MNEIKIFESKEFGSVRTVTINDEPWFVGKDVAEALGYKDTSDALKRHADDEDKLTRCFTDSGQSREMYIINESGLYSLILGSKLESAKRFKHWVTSEVLPSIRQNGTYQKPMTALEQLQLTQQAVMEVNTKVDAVNQDLQDFKMELPILGIEIDRITSAVHRRGVSALGSKQSPAYQNRSLRSKVYQDIYRELKRQFGVVSYKEIRRNQCGLAISVIDEYELPYILQEQILAENEQMSLDLEGIDD